MGLVIVALLLVALSAEGATEEEKAALKLVAEELGIPGSIWDLSTDPCSARWPGVGCCADRSTYCCQSPTSIYNNPPVDTSSCDFTTDARVTVLLLRTDLISTVLKGTLRTSSSLCRLSSLLLLDVENNNLNGAFPTCLHNLTSLRVLRLGGNRINGSIPPQLGLLQSLQRLHLESLYLTGTIPATLGNLTSITSMKLEYNQLEGTIPIELTNIPRLQYLGLQGNKFTGGIPPFGKELMFLMLSGNLLSGELSGPSLNAMVACSNLDLRGNALNGSIPDINLPSLKTLDLSFNRFSGGIPKFQTDKLQTLLLSHNNLTGELVLNRLPSSLQAFDVSHNRLQAGNVEFNKQVNYAFNNNTLNTERGNNLFFAVNAGGNRAFIHNNLTYDGDTDTPGSNSNSSVGVFYIPGRTWALELSGTSAGTYTVYQSAVIENTTRDIELYQSMRWCSSYMAYHGVGLQPGPYTVTLHFAELVFDKPEHRVFDVFVGGRMVKQGLDVVKETGGPRRAYKLKVPNATVSSNGTLSVELVYRSGKGGGPAISAISVVSPSYRYVGRRRKNMAGPLAGGVLAVILVVCVGVWWWRKRKVTTVREVPLPPRPLGLYDYSLSSSGSFSYNQLYQATNGFSEKLGEGGFGVVYKGTLPDGVEIAVKQLLVQSNVEDFKREIYILSKVRHKNLASVLGHCFESGLPMLVTEFMPNGTLDKWLFQNEDFVLTWEQRTKIAIGVACGLEYLHHESKYKILHLDIKPGNILLDADMNPAITDFGLSKLYENVDGKTKSHLSATRVRGTMGYIAPEYAMKSVLSDKVDVYAFGVVLLELISGRRAFDFLETSDKVLLVEWAHKQMVNKFMDGMVDGRLGEEFDKEQAKDMVSIGIMCTHKKPAVRPKMQKVWLMLNGHVKVSDVLATLVNESDNEVVYSDSSTESS